MDTLKPTKFAIATGLTSVVIYLGCNFIMSILGKESLVKLANLLFHGMDFTTIVRLQVPILETLIGTVVSFIFWGVIGYILAFIYNKIL